jgi:probable F420-dependent oxidoreductase
MQIGFNLPVSGPMAEPAAMARMARLGEELGFDYLTLTDHIALPDTSVPGYPYSESGAFYSPEPGHRHEQLIAAAFVAARTERIRLVLAVLVVPHRPAVLAAKMLTTLDVLSGGRLTVGVGAGWLQAEFDAVVTTPFAERGAVTDEYLDTFRALWTEDRPRIAGKYVRYGGLVFDPKPVQRPHPPIWVGCARSEDSFQWAGKNGFNLMTLPYLYREPHILPGLVKKYRQGLADAGHDFTTTEVLGKFHIYVSGSLDQAIEEAAPYLESYFDVHKAADPERNMGGGLLTVRDVKTQLAHGFVIAGDPQRCVDTIHKWREEVGLTTISGTFHFGGMPQEMALKNIRLFAERVMPEFK